MPEGPTAHRADKGTRFSARSDAPPLNLSIAPYLRTHDTRLAQERRMNTDNAVKDNPAESRFELPVENELAVAYYQIRDGRFVLTHTEVPQHLSGQGIGSTLA